MELFQSLLSNLWSVFLIVLFFGGSIFVHELGHFLLARWRGARVERFSIGFGPKIFSWHGKDGVEYRLSWLPLGGYVVLPQLADMRGIEGQATADAKVLPPLDYLSKMLILTAGVVCNLIFAFVLACLLWGLGQPVTEEEQSTRIGFVHPTVELPDGKEVPGPAQTAGLQTNDVIRQVDGQAVSAFSEIDYLVAIGAGRGSKAEPTVQLTIERNGQTQNLTIFPSYSGPEGMREIGVEPAVKATVNEVAKDSAAEAAGLKPGDILLQLDDQPVTYLGFVADYLKQNGGRALQVTYARDGQTRQATLQPRLTLDPATKKSAPRLGVMLRSATTDKMVHTPPWTQLQKQALSTWRTLLSLLNPHSDIGASKLSGPIGIGRVFWASTKSDYPFRAAMWFTILVNVNLAFFNLLPLPVLDGGHMVFATIGRLRGKAMPASFVATAQSVFIVLLLSLVLYVSYFDLRRGPPDQSGDKPAPAAAAGSGK